MPLADYAELLGPQLFDAISRKGYAELTAVQRAVLDPALSGRDLRITSQTGSGKTLAIGLALRALTYASPQAMAAVTSPRALIVAPTRELAHQVEQELTWLYADSGLRLATTTGGASYRAEHRALARRPDVVVGTPGRLLDHLERGTIDPSQVETVVLDEADRMLELGFREDLEKLWKFVPERHTTHLVSATFPRMVRSLADKLQRDPAHVEGTQLGAANEDIDHVLYVVDPQQRLDALVNLLLAHPADQTLVFVRTRADAGHIANELIANGFAASALSGEMDQNARNRTLAAYRQGGLRILIATDVAARGIDVPDVSLVVHGELPTNADAYTHRAGRTGRAGRKGTSALLVSPAGVVHVTRLLRVLRAPHRFGTIPTPEEILRADDERAFDELTQADWSGADPERWQELTARLMAAGSVERTLARLLAKSHQGVTTPRTVRSFPLRTEREPKPAAKPERHEKHRAEKRRPEKQAPERQRPEEGQRPEKQRPEKRRVDKQRPEKAGAFTSFHVSWGERQGADARRLLAMVCRRGQVRGRDVGAIRVNSNFSLVEVANDVASAFARAVSRPDPGEPEIVIRLDRAQPRAELEVAKAKLRRPSHAGGGGHRPLRRRASQH